MNFKNNKAFTLAETLIVVVVLGIVASITIPAVVKRHKEMAERTKVKKCMTVFDQVVNKMVVENGIKNEEALISYAGNEENDCLNSTTYFNKSSGDGCKFKTPDGVWWDISDITNPKIAFKEDDLSEDNAVDMKKKFELFAWFDNKGSLRIDDLEASSGDKETQLAKLYNYLNGVKEVESRPYLSCNQRGTCDTYDEKGRQTGWDCNEYGTNCFAYYTYTQNGDKTIKTGGFDCNESDISSCPHKQYFTLDKENREIGSNCNQSGTGCDYYYTYTQNGDKTIKTMGWGSGCTEGNISSCPFKSYYTLDEKGRETGDMCNESGTICDYYFTYTQKGDKTIKTMVGGSGCTESNIGSCPNIQYSTLDDKGRLTGEYCNESGEECSTTYTITEQ